MYKYLFRHMFTKVDAERAHTLALKLLKTSEKFPLTRSLLSGMLIPKLEKVSIEALNLRFDHPLGLAAGFDKDAHYLRGLDLLGFSFIEAGTVTPNPQSGNPRKRLFRLIEDEALINRLGFPSMGARVVQKNLRTQQNYKHPIGISLGKNTETALADAHRDYCAVLTHLYSLGDFFVVNISSPNTLELIRLQTVEYLANLLNNINEHLNDMAEGQTPKPLLVKIAPDLEWAELDVLIELCLKYRVAGIIATNTTTKREYLRSVYKNETGGLSGRPLKDRTTEIIRHIYRRTQDQICIIGVGGIFSGDDVWEKMMAGATLVQAYTGLIYEGPMFVKKTITQLHHKMDKEGVRELREIIGIESET